MQSAELERTTVDIAAKVGPRNLELRATGQVIKFDGFLTLYNESKDDEADEDEGRLPPMKAGDPLERRRINASQHFTEPPPRYSEASLVKRMEELGIGRPSTYAAVLQTLRDREYVKIEKKRLVPEAGFPLTVLPGRGIQRRLTLENVRSAVGLVRACGQAFSLVRRLRPRVVVSLGGYASVPASLAVMMRMNPPGSANADRARPRSLTLVARDR